jgi:hypothetical protein
MQDKKRAILWIMQYISFLILKREYLAKPFRNAMRSISDQTKIYEEKRS